MAGDREKVLTPSVCFKERAVSSGFALDLLTSGKNNLKDSLGILRIICSKYVHHQYDWEIKLTCSKPSMIGPVQH